MKVMLQVEFEVSGTEDDDGAEDGAVAKSAASMAALDYLCLTPNGEFVCEEVTVHVDGHGKCVVKLGEDHE